MKNTSNFTQKSDSTINESNICFQEDMADKGKIVPDMNAVSTEIMKQLCPDLFYEMERLKAIRPDTPEYELAQKQMESISFLSSFVPAYRDIADYCKKNGIIDIVNLSPHYMFPVIMFRGIAACYTEQYPYRSEEACRNIISRFYKGPEGVGRGDLPEEHAIFTGNFGEKTGRATIDSPAKRMAISVDFIGWDGPRMNSQLESWDFLYQKIYENYKRAMFFMPFKNLPEDHSDAFPGKITPITEGNHMSLGRVGLYLFENENM